jgi:endonuclease/exonuclease/phosphatase (EEP) superfamily protein YafD
MFQISVNIAFSVLLVVWVALTVSCRGMGTNQIAELSASDRILPANITVVNWNIQKGKHPLFAKDPKSLLEQEKPDILFLQEAETDLFEAVQMGGYFAEGWSYPWTVSFFLSFNPLLAQVLNYNTSDHRPILVKLKLQP